MTDDHDRGRGRRWLKRFGHRDEPAETLLLCFHHAGGNAAMYRQWPGLLPRSIEPVAVQLPGRADRFREPAHERMAPLVDELVEVLAPLLERPYACYGVSMGARVTWALAHALRERAMPLPRMLFVAAAAAPILDNGRFDWEGRTDGLEGYVRELGGTPDKVLAEPGLLSAFMPTLRADLTVLSTHHFRPATPLDVRIRAFAGIDDRVAGSARMTGWRMETAARFDLGLVSGGHFFDSAGEQEVIRTIGDDLG
jgi:medium-chain acyl-[acyl-carrier-protein] hydrolase